MSTPANPKKRKWLTWYHLYCLLAAFDVLTISASLYLNHAVLGIYSASVEENSAWSDRIGNYSKLSELAAAVNAPGNDAFDSGDIVDERRRLAEAHAAIQKATTTARQDLEQNTRREDSHELLRQLSKIDAQVALIHKEATAVFVELEDNRQDSAGSRMAAMDRCFSQTLVLIGALCEKVRDSQSARFEAETTRAQQFSTFVLALAGVVCLILCLATWYAHKMANLMRQFEVLSLDNKGQLAAIAKSQMVIEFDMDGTITKVNDKILQAMGYSQEEILGKNHSILVEPAYRESDEYRKFWEKLNRGDSVLAEYKRLGKHGQEVWFQASYTPILDLNDKPIKVVKYAFDITQQKLLNITNNQLVAALNVSNDCLFTFDAKTLEFVYTNHGAKEQIGYTSAELAKMTPVDIKPDFDDHSFAAAIAPLYEKPGTSMVFRTRHQHKDGHCIPVEISLQLIEGLGDHGLFIAAVRDISAQLESEREVSDARARLERATNGTSDGLWDYIPATGEVWYADQFKKLVGFEPHEYDQFEPVLDSLVDLLHPDDKDRTFAAINAHLEDDVPYDVEYRLRMRSGGYRWFRARGRATRDEHGIATRMSGSTCDVQATRDAFELVEQANKAKSEFLANMSHEIRTPMTAILGYSELLCGDLANDPTQVADAVRTIQSNANYLLTIINDILDVSKIEAGQMAVEAIQTSPAQIISEVLSLVRPRAIGKGVDVGVTYQTPIPEHIQSDPTRLRQILVNLIGNAIKFTECGSVTIHASCDPKSQQLKLGVVDTGIGMSPEQCQVISKFQAFSQADASTTRKFGGSGLGLRISNALAQLLGGGIEVSSVQGQGSTFTATIATGDLDRVTMLKPEEALSNKSQDRTNDQEQAASNSAVGKVLIGLRILLAEDGADNQQLIAFHLRKAGAEVEIAENGRIALERLDAAAAEGLPFALLLTDMQMPEMDGYTLARTLRAHGERIPIVALTAHAMAEDRRKCLEAGCNDYATKPINKAALISTCRRWMKNNGGDVDPTHKKPAFVKIPVDSQSVSTEILLSELADDPDMDLLINRFVGKLGTKVTLMREYLSNHQLDQLGCIAHQLKGAGGGYGFPSISKSARHLEECAKTDIDLAKIQSAVSELATICERAMAGGIRSGSQSAGASTVEQKS